MQLHTVTSHNNKRVQRIGRGGKRGTTSGRGTKGQRSRAGRRIRPAMRDLIIRLPKHRGFRNKPLTAKAVTIDLKKLCKTIAAHTGALTVDHVFLRAAGLIPMGYRGAVKVLGAAEVKQALTLKGVGASKGALALIEKAGGKAE